MPKIPNDAAKTALKHVPTANGCKPNFAAPANDAIMQKPNAYLILLAKHPVSAASKIFYQYAPAASSLKQNAQTAKSAAFHMPPANPKSATKMLAGAMAQNLKSVFKMAGMTPWIAQHLK